MLVAAALLVALAGSGAVAGSSGPSRSSDEGTSVQGAPPAAQPNGGQGFMHNGRHCHHGEQQAPQQDPTGAPPV
jgi:hypothetical protein